MEHGMSDGSVKSLPLVKGIVIQKAEINQPIPSLMGC